MPDKWAQYVVQPGSNAQVNVGATVGNNKPVGVAQGVSNPPNGGAVTNVDSDDPWAQYAVSTQPTPAGANGPLPAQPKAPVPTALQGPRSALRNLASAAGDVALPAGDAGIGALKGAGSTLDNIGNVATLGLTSRPALKFYNKHLGTDFNVPTSEQEEAPFQATDTAQKVGKGIEQAGEFLIPGLGEEAATAKAGKFAPLARVGYNALTSGALNKLQGGGFGTGALAGGLGSGVGEVSRIAAPALAESALNVTGANRMYGRTVGRAILDDTRGIRPETIERSARSTISQLTPEVEQIANNAAQAGSRGSLNPAISSIDKRIAAHTTNRAVNSAAELKPLKNFLERDAVTGLPLASSQPPQGLLQLKRGLDADFIGNWNPTRNTNNELDAAKSAYGKLADEFHASAPGTQDLDQRVSSLIPVAERANRTALGAGMVQNTLNRFRTPTGALVGMLGGAGAGFEERGVPGALTGAVAGAALPALVGSPEMQMMIARSANGFFPRLAIPLTVGGALQLRSGLNKKPD